MVFSITIIKIDKIGRGHIMKILNKALAISMLALLPLGGCSTSGVSTHGLYDNTHTSSIREDRDQFEYPKSNHVSLKGDQSRALLVQGREHFGEQNYGLAEKHFRKAVETRADNASAWLGLAASLDQLGRFEFADRAYAQLATLRGDDARILNNLGYSHLLRGDYKKARRYFNKAQKIDPTLEEVQGNLHLLEKVISS